MTRGRVAGFTLIEMLVALALTALVCLVLLHGVRLAAAGLDRHTRQAERLDDRRALDEVLRRALGSAAARGFAGRPEALSWLSLAEDSGPGLYRIELVRRGESLVMRRRLADPAGDPRAAESVLADKLRTFRLGYFGVRDAGEPAAWHESWEGLAGPPRLVRMILLDANGIARPPLVVPIWSAGS